MNTTKALHMIAIAGLTLTTSALLVGCSDSASSGTAHSEADSHAGHNHGTETTANATTDAQSAHDLYTDLLGEIVQLPVEGDASTALKIHHVQIPDFKTKDGEININSKGIAGMMSMTMPFPLADGVSIEGMQVGDKIKFDFQVNWGGDRAAWEITAIEKIDPATVIDYTNKIEEIKEDIKNAAEDMMDDAMDHSDHGMGTDGP